MASKVQLMLCLAIMVSALRVQARSRFKSRREFVRKKSMCEREKKALISQFSDRPNADAWKEDYTEDCQSVDSFQIRNMTAADAMEWLIAAKGESKSAEMLVNERNGLTTTALKTLLDNMTSIIQDHPHTMALFDKGFINSLALIGNAYFKQTTGLKSLVLDNVREFGFLLPYLLQPQSYGMLSDEVFDFILDLFNDNTDKFMADLASGKFADFDFANTTFLKTDYGGSLATMLIEDQTKLKALCRSAFTRYKGLDTLPVENLNKLRYLLPCAKASECKNIPDSWVKDNFNTIKLLPTSCNVKSEHMIPRTVSRMFPAAAVCGRYLMEKALTGNNAVAFSTLQDMARFDAFIYCVPRQYIKTAVESGGCELVTKLTLAGLEMQEINKYSLENCLELPQDLSTVTCADITTKYRSFLPEMKMSFYDGLPKSVLCDSACITAFKAIDNFPEKVKRKLTKKCFSDYNQAIEGATVDELGAMVTDLPPEKFKDLKAADLERNIAVIKNDIKMSASKKQRQQKKAVMKELGKKLIKSGKISAVKDSREIMREMSIKDLKSSLTDVEADLDLDNVDDNLALTDSQTKWVMNQLKKKKRPGNYSVEDIRKKKSLVKGFLRSDIEEIAETQSSSDDPQNIEMAKAFCEQTDMPLAPLKEINRNLIVGGLEAINKTNPFAFLSENDVNDIGCQCMMHFKGAELSQMPEEICSDVCAKIGSCNRFRCMPPKHRRKFLQACMNCMNVNSPNLSEGDMGTLGMNLISELTEEEVKARVSADVLATKLVELKDMCMDKSFREGVTSLLETKFGGDGSAIDKFQLPLLGSAIMYFPRAMQEQMDMSIIYDMIDEIKQKINPTDESEIKLQKCCERWRDKEDKEDFKQLKHNLMLTIVDALRWQKANARRKRSAATFTCDVIRLIGEAFTTVSNEEINGVADEEFTECLSDIGQFPSWNESQKMVLLEKAISTLNSTVCNMTSDQLVQLGTIAQVISLEDLQCLPLSESELVTALGGLTGWNSSKLATLAEGYLSANSISDMSSISISEIGVLGELVCGFQPGKLSTISVAVVGGSGVQLGRLEECSVEQYKALKDRVMDQSAYGDVQNWTAADVTELKNILVGLTSDDIQQLSTDAIEGLHAEVISKFPGAVLAAMMTEQFSSMTSGQVALVSAEQMQHLSDAQQKLLTEIRGSSVPSSKATDTSEDGGKAHKESKAGTMITTALWILTLAVMLILLEP